MKTIRIVLLFCCLAFVFGTPPETAAQTTAFTYQGRLTDSSGPVTGLHDFEFRLFNAATGGAQQGSTVTLNDLGVTNGLFTAPLDFGANFPGADRFLQISVRPGASAGAYADLSPRQPITSTPYAVTARGISGTLPAGQLSGSVADALLSPNVALRSGGNSFTGNQSIAGGSLSLNDASSSINFPTPTAGSPGMINMFPGGTSNPDRMVIAHSSGFPGWGLQYQDSTDQFNFLGAGISAMTVVLGGGGFVGIGTNSPQARLDVAGDIRGSADSVPGVSGTSVSGNGVQGTSTSGNGVQGSSASASTSGVYGENTSGGGAGVAGRTTGGGSAVYGDNSNPNGWAGNFNGNVSVSGNQFFGNQTRQMLNLYNADYGIGVQANAAYFRTANEFLWYRGGSHSDDFGDPGSGGGSLMRLGSSGDLLLVGNLGIGTTSPGTHLDVVAGQGLGRFTSTNTANGSVLIFNNRSPLSDYLGAINFETNGSTVGQIAYLATDRLVFRTGGAERMSLQSGLLTVQGVGNEKAFIGGAANEVVIGSATPNVTNIRFGNLTASPLGPMDCYARSFNSTSDRHAKQDFRSVEAAAILEKVLALPISEWAYKGEAATRHIGPVAQDFKEAFGLGNSDKSIATVDADGVALAAIQGLNRKMEVENAALKERVEKLEKLLQKLANQ